MAITNLTGYTWTGNTAINVSGSGRGFSINFDSNGVTGYNYFSYGSGVLNYSKGPGTSKYAYQNNQWASSADRTITITGGSAVTNTTLIAWLQENGVLKNASDTSMYLIQESALEAIADAIHTVNGETASYTPPQMADKILELTKGLPELPPTSEWSGSTFTLDKDYIVRADYALDQPYVLQIPFGRTLYNTAEFFLKRGTLILNGTLQNYGRIYSGSRGGSFSNSGSSKYYNHGSTYLWHKDININYYGELWNNGYLFIYNLNLINNSSLHLVAGHAKFASLNCSDNAFVTFDNSGTMKANGFAPTTSLVLGDNYYTTTLSSTLLNVTTTGSVLSSGERAIYIIGCSVAFNGTVSSDVKVYNLQGQLSGSYIPTYINYAIETIPELPPVSEWSGTTFTMDKDYQITGTYILPEGYTLNTYLLVPGDPSTSAKLYNRGELIFQGGTYNIQEYCEFHNYGRVYAGTPYRSVNTWLCNGTIYNHGSIDLGSTMKPPIELTFDYMSVLYNDGLFQKTMAGGVLQIPCLGLDGGIIEFNNLALDYGTLLLNDNASTSRIILRANGGAGNLTFNPSTILGTGEFEIENHGGTVYMMDSLSESLSTTQVYNYNGTVHRNAFDGQIIDYKLPIYYEGETTITDISGYVWQGHSSMTVGTFNVYLNFKSNGAEFNRIRMDSSVGVIEYLGSNTGAITVYSSGAWSDKAYSVIDIIDGTDTMNHDLINWMLGSGSFNLAIDPAATSITNYTWVGNSTITVPAPSGTKYPVTFLNEGTTWVKMQGTGPYLVYWNAVASGNTAYDSAVGEGWQDNCQVIFIESCTDATILQWLKDNGTLYGDRVGG